MCVCVCVCVCVCGTGGVRGTQNEGMYRDGGKGCTDMHTGKTGQRDGEEQHKYFRALQLYTRGHIQLYLKKLKLAVSKDRVSKQKIIPNHFQQHARIKYINNE